MRRSLLLPVFLAVLAGGCQPAGVRPAALDEVVALRAEAEQSYAGEDWQAAEKAYRRLTEIVPTEADNWFRLGNVYVRLGRHYDAIALYREALVRDPHHARAWHNLGMTQLRVATSTFMEMQQYTDAESPVTQRARQVVEAVERLLQQELAAPPGEHGP